MKKLFIASMMLMLSQFIIAQTIGEVDLKEINNYGLRKLKDAPKKVFISQFRINFQTMYLDTEKKSGGFRGGSDYTRSYKSAVFATVALGLKGLQEKDLIDITDELYKNLVDQLKAEGFEIITAEQALVSDELKDWVKRTGGILNQAQYDGYVSVSPTGFDYLVKGVNDDGKEKNSFFNKAPKISQQLGGAMVLIVNLAVPFANEAESGGSKLLGRLGGGAKVVAETNLAITAFRYLFAAAETPDLYLADSTGIACTFFMKRSSTSNTLKKPASCPHISTLACSSALYFFFSNTPSIVIGFFSSQLPTLIFAILCFTFKPIIELPLA